MNEEFSKWCRTEEGMKALAECSASILQSAFEAGWETGIRVDRDEQAWADLGDDR